MHGGDIYRNKVNTDFSVNLNPLGPPPEVLHALQTSLGMAGYYPDPRQDAVRDAIAQYERTEPDCIAAGCGASQLILAAVRAEGPRSALVYEPAYSGYEYALHSAGCFVQKVPLREEDDYVLTKRDLGALDVRPDMVFLCDPANPAGKNIDTDLILDLLDRTKGRGTRVVLDESFLLMSRKAAAGNMTGRGDLVRRYDNLYIVRSLTKLFALPGIRMGYVMSAPGNISRIMGQLPEWNLPVTAQEAIRAGMEVLGKTDYLRRTQETVAAEREYLAQMLRESGMDVYESDAPYLLFRGPEMLCEALLSRGILIRDCSDFPGLGKGMFRIAVKEHAACESFCRTLREVMNETGDCKA